MKHSIVTAVMASSLLFDSNALATSSSAAQKKSSPEQSGGTFKYSANSKVATEQKNMYDMIIKYQNVLNAGDTKTILGLFADESYSQWSDKLTADNTEKHQGQYDDLFKHEKFETDLAFDFIWINGNTVAVRTHHHAGSVITNFKKQKTITGLSRGVFVLSKISDEWEIFLYAFNTSPLQDVA